MNATKRNYRASFILDNRGKEDSVDQIIEQTRLERERTAKTVEAEVKQAWLLVRALQQTIKALHAQVVAATIPGITQGMSVMDRASARPTKFWLSRIAAATPSST